MTQIVLRRIEVSGDIAAASALDRPDYGVAFEVRMPNARSRSAEQWARAVFEDAARPTRAFLRAGWRFGLGFQLGRAGSPDHVLGHEIVHNDRDRVVLELRSRLFRAHNVFLVDDERVRWATFVRYDVGAGKPLWLVAARVHEVTALRLLHRAAARRGPVWDALFGLSKRLNVVVMRLVRQGRLGKNMTVVTYTGRRSGRTFSTPVAYQRIGDEVTIGVAAPEHKRWWRNFEGEGRSISLIVDDVTRSGHATAERDARGRVSVKVRLAARPIP